jgi:hypothetical protein
VELALENYLEGDEAGQYVPSQGTAKALIRLSMDAPDLHQTLAHEDWHAVEGMLLEMGEAGKRILAACRT